MWIVRLALRRPYTFVVMAMLIAFLGVLAITRMPTDILPEIDIPVIAAVWQYGGLPPEEIDKRLIGNYERVITTTVNDVEHVESQSLAGVGIVKVFFQPGVNIAAANAQVTAISQTVLRQYPPGTTPPLIMQYSATNVPVLQLSLGSDTLPEQQVFDQWMTIARNTIVTAQGAQSPYPFGGKNRQIMIDLDLAKLYARGLSPNDLTTAIAGEQLILPGGTAKIGTQEYQVLLNSSVEKISDLANLPIKSVNGATVYVRDVATVRDGYAPQQSLVHVDGKKGVLVSIMRAQGSSTLDVVARVKALLPAVTKQVSSEMHITPLFDQSIFVRAAVSGVLKEATIAAGLTAVMILLFLGSWRSTVVILVSIPLSIFVAIIALWALGHSLNLMTLGGLSLAVGILVDDATVEIENVHRNLGMKKGLVHAILDGASQIAVPAFVSTLCICIVFVPIVFIQGAAKSLFVPLGLGVAFAMMTSYLLSRTLVPTMVRALLHGEAKLYQESAHGEPEHAGIIGKVHNRFNHAFERLRARYGLALAWSLAHPLTIISSVALVVAGSLLLTPMLGRDFFPAVDAGQIRMHVRGPAGTRLEETEVRMRTVTQVIREIVPAEDIDVVIDNNGLPISGINLVLGDPSMISAADSEVLVALKEGKSGHTAEYSRRIRRALAERLPDTTIFFLPADISTQVLNFGVSAPIDVQLAGPRGNFGKEVELARKLREQISKIPGAVDVHLHQVTESPQLRIDVDRTRADQIGLTQRDIANDLLTSLSSSGQVAPNYWLDGRVGVQYLLAAQTPQYRMDSIAAIETTPLRGTLTPNEPLQLLGNVAKIRRASGAVNITHFNAMPTLDVLANVDGTDLGSVADAIEKLTDKTRAELPRGSQIVIKGQVESMNASFRGLAGGLALAILLVYLLMAVNFQSWIDPLVILMALPGALAGILWILFATHTTLSVPALMGAIMSVGVATANSILLVTFANDQRGGEHGMNAHDAALAAGMTRLRPVMMTALAMLAGMLPMSLGLGEGGEQNAPLGRAVIGGLSLATFATLFLVPVIYSLMRKKAAAPLPPEEAELLADD
ncbi:MAG: efflux RND transporter permease subunit [Polyangiales bacterium]